MFFLLYKMDKPLTSTNVVKKNWSLNLFSGKRKSYDPSNVKVVCSKHFIKYFVRSIFLKYKSMGRSTMLWKLVSHIILIPRDNINFKARIITNNLFKIVQAMRNTLGRVWFWSSPPKWWKSWSTTSIEEKILFIIMGFTPCIYWVGL